MRRAALTVFYTFSSPLPIKHSSSRPALSPRPFFTGPSSHNKTDSGPDQHHPSQTPKSSQHGGGCANSDNVYGGGEAIHFYKSRGQHILTNPRVLDAIVDKVGVRPSDTVLEVGPGTGNLTVRLLRSARSVVAVEIDGRMVEVLHRRAVESGLEDRLTVINADALKIQLPSFDICVSNIPYSISSPLLERLLFSDDDGRRSPRIFRSATLLLQREFAQRLLAEPGDSEFNRLAANVNLVATSHHVMHVSRRDFVPCPRVDSSVVEVRPKSEVPAVDLQEWWAFTLACFGKKNKTLGAIFRQKRRIAELSRLVEGKVVGDPGRSSGDSSFKDTVIEILRAEGFEDKRPSKLSHRDLLHLLSLFNKAGIYFRYF